MYPALRLAAITGVALSAAALAACSSPTGTGGNIPVPPPGFSLYGNVRTSTGGAVTAATFSATGTIGRCGTNRGPAAIAARSGLVDTTGFYRLSIDATVIDTVCLRLVARRSASSNADSIVAPSTSVAIKPNELRDSVRIDFVFP